MAANSSARSIGVARGLAAAHDEGVVHRDLKPQNILLHEDLRPRVADFGLARSMGKPKWTDGAIGTLCYVAPEILAAPGHELGDARSDQWSFFVTLCQCIDGWPPMLPLWTREEPKSDARMLRLIARWLRRSKLVGTEIPDALAQILRVGLALDPGERFENMHVVADELEKVSVRGLVAGPPLALAPSSEGVVVNPVSDEAVALAPTWWKLRAMLTGSSSPAIRPSSLRRSCMRHRSLNPSGQAGFVRPPCDWPKWAKGI